MDRLAEAEVRLAGLESDHGSKADTHPDVIKTRQIVKKIDQQLEDRLDGILEGLKAKTAAAKAHLDSMQKVLDDPRRNRTDFATETPWRSYFTAKADLQNLKLVREKLRLRIIQEKIDMAIERSK